MVNVISRTDKSAISLWWWRIDRTLLFCVLALCVIGLILVYSGSPAVAKRIDLSSQLGFVLKQLFIVFVGLFVMLSISFLNLSMLKKFVLLGMIGSIILLIINLFIGVEIKGSTRWIRILGFSIQSSEIVKPFFVVFSAWLCSVHVQFKNIQGIRIVFFVYILIVLLLLLQPDIGQIMVITTVFIAHLILSGLPFKYLGFLISGCSVFLIAAFFIFEHVRKRIEVWWSPEKGDAFQLDKSKEAFYEGGIFGKGIGNGNVKEYIPDVHSDFIFSVLGEETGLFGVIIVISIFVMIVKRSMEFVFKSLDPFKIYAVVGIIVELLTQTLIHMGGNIGLIPTKGITLPFISYGGSAFVGTAISYGILLSLTKIKN